MSVVLLRHASAGDRDAWDGDDRLRPLDEQGYGQALAAGRLVDREPDRRAAARAAWPKVWRKLARAGR